MSRVTSRIKPPDRKIILCFLCIFCVIQDSKPQAATQKDLSQLRKQRVLDIGWLECHYGTQYGESSEI